MAEKKTLVINATSDLACPWCYVGAKRLENAAKKFENSLKVEVRWTPYMIDMRTKPEGEDYNAYCQRRWGGDGWVPGMKQ